jgi:prevent-host-death family protein
MDRVTVAELKAKLSHYLREVRAGRSFTVVSRDVPVATLGPYDPDDNGDELEFIPADPDAPSLWEPVLGPSSLTTDAVDLIRRDRDESDARLDSIMRESSGGGESPEDQDPIE